MSKTIERIVNATGLSELLNEIDTFCEESYMREDDTECMELVKMVKSKEDSDIHVLLGSYLSICEDGDEVIESLYEFASNCISFPLHGSEFEVQDFCRDTQLCYRLKER